MSLDPAGQVFSALADPTRREVINCLSRQPSLTATELAGLLPVSRQAIAKHLAELQGAHLVVGEKVGREHRFRLTPAPMTQAMQWMASVGTEWDERLHRLGRQLGAEQPPS